MRVPADAGTAGPDSSAERAMPPRLLIVDDEPDLELLIRQRFRRQIRKNQLEFVFAHDGMEALAKLGDDPGIDLVVTDINMPKMDGLTLLSNLADVSTEARAIIVSAYGDMENIRTAMNRGALDFVTKPIDFQDLELTLDKTLGQVRQIKDSLQAIQDKNRIEEQLLIAREIQQNLNPLFLPEVAGFDLGAWTSPCDEIGGDHYDFISLSDSRVGLVVGDVSGHGVGAALLAATARAYLRALVARTDDVGATVTELNRLLDPDLDEDQFMTLIFGVLDAEQSAFQFASAGHDPPIHYHADTDTFEEYESGGFPLGVVEEAEYDVDSPVQMRAGDILAICTDGVWEASTATKGLFGKERVYDTIRARRDSDAADLAGQIAEAVNTFCGNAPPRDDMTVTILKCLPSD